MSYATWRWIGVIVLGLSIPSALAITSADEPATANVAQPAAAIAPPAVAQSGGEKTEQADAAGKVRTALDSPLEDPVPAPDKGKDAPPSGPRGYSTTGYLAAVALFLVVVALAWFRFKSGRGASPGLVQSPVTPGLEIVIPDRNDYPIMVNDVFLNSIVGKDIIAADERELLVARFTNNGFAILLHLAELMPKHKSLLGRLWGDSLGVAYVDPLKTAIQYETIALFTEEFLDRHPVLPLYELSGALTVATYNPKDAALMKEIENSTGRFISPVFAFPDQIAACLAIGKATAADLENRTASLPSGLAEADGASGAPIDWVNNQTVANFARDLMLLALRKRASDIHIEPNEEDAVVRFRIDGILEEVMRLNLARLPYLVNVIKIRAGVDIADRRRPQDGHLSLDLAGRALDFRYSSVPTTCGEKIVLRLLGQNELMSVPDLDQLGCSRLILDNMRRIIGSPNGVFFVTGPTGSGKTTTLYAALKSINRRGLNIMTIEDPVEYHLPGINQVQVNPAAGVTFATALRAFLRQDPDVILVGEVRDLETAKVAAQAALTGHLVLTTMHTNNALQAITRLIQIGVEPFLVAPSIIGVMAQRLVRKLCTACREQYELTPLEMQARFECDAKTTVQVWRSKGCRECSFTGYLGRIAIQELFLIDDATRELIAHDATILDIKTAAFSKGFTTMRRDGFKKVLRGLTTFQEVDHVTMEEE
ncbi:MAG: type II/IV secretion system protein [Verrucomicrobia bacterium]|nr:type II/IV secretion system protein [Verrucomicrobiota bacterium]